MRDDLQRQLSDLVVMAHGEGASKRDVLDAVKNALAEMEEHRRFTEVDPRLAYGNQTVCTHAPEGPEAIVHACKEPCHRYAVGYSGRSLDRNHPNYLSLERGRHLYLNLVNPPVPLFQIASFRTFLDFADRQQAQGRAVLIHCNQGEGRSPALALVYLAKRLLRLPGSSYQLASTAFRAKGYVYRPGQGLDLWLTENWEYL